MKSTNPKTVPLPGPPPELKRLFPNRHRASAYASALLDRLQRAQFLPAALRDGISKMSGVTLTNLTNLTIPIRR